MATTLIPLDIENISYANQARYVTLMKSVISRLLAAASQVDPVIQKEVDALPEGYVFEMRTAGLDARILMQKTPQGLIPLAASTEINVDLSIRFKHLTHAFLVFTFQENTSLAQAHDRLVVDGEVALLMKVVRSLNHLQAVILPKFIADKAVKTLPEFTLREKLFSAGKTYSQFMFNLIKER